MADITEMPKRLRELSRWLLANNVDMKMPDGMIDPADAADVIETALKTTAVEAGGPND